MGRTITCPACQAAITLKQLFWTKTLLRFKCPHCGTGLQPTDKAFVTRWLIIAALVGVVAAVAALTISGLADALWRGLGYAALVVLVAGAVVIIKWRASLALIEQGELRVAK